MKKRVILLVALAIALGLAVCKNLIVKSIIENTIYSVAGLKVKTESLEIGILRPRIMVKGLTLMNPADFPEGVMFEIPIIYIEYEFGSLFRANIHIKDMVFHLKSLNIIKNKSGKLNLNSLNIMDPNKDKKAGPARRVTVTIDKLYLKGAKVLYKDYTHAPFPMVREFSVDVDERYVNVGDPYQLGSLIVSRSLQKTGFSQYIGFDMTRLQENIKGAVATGAGVIRGTAEQATGVLKGTQDALTGVFGMTKDSSVN